MLTSTIAASLALAGAAFAAPAPEPSFTPVPHPFPSPQLVYELVYRGPGNLHCDSAGLTGYHYNVTVFNPEPYTEFSSCKNLFNPARAFQIGVKPGSDQLKTSRYINNGKPGNYRLPYLSFYSGPNCSGQFLGQIPENQDPLTYSPPPGPANSTYGTCYENSQLARSAQLVIGTTSGIPPSG